MNAIPEIEGSGDRPRAGTLLASRLPFLVDLWRGEAPGKRGTGRQAIQEERSELLAGELSPGELRSVGAALLRLQRGLTGERSLAGEAYMEESDLLGAYLLYYWPVSYLQVSLALAELPSKPRRVLDLGSGPGPASAAIVDAFTSTGSPGSAGDMELLLADKSPRALALAARILHPTSLATRVLDLETDTALPEGPFDFIVLSHCLNELWKGAANGERRERRLELLVRVLGLLSSSGRLLVVEPALLGTSREALELRDELAQRGFGVAGPCPGSWPCPALASGPDRTCHAEARWQPPEPVASLAREAGLDRQSVKATWFALRPNNDAALAHASPGESEPAPKAADIGRGRVVSDRMLNKAGRVRLFICAGGALRTVSARKDDSSPAARAFLSLRRGDIVSLAGAETRPGDTFGITAASALRILERAVAP